MESYEQCRQGRSYCSLCTLDTIHRLFFVTRLIINKIDKVQWVDFKLENVLISPFLKNNGPLALRGLGLFFLRDGKLLGHSPIHNTQINYSQAVYLFGNSIVNILATFNRIRFGY